MRILRPGAGRSGGFLGSGVWSEGKDCVERNRSERAKVASVASEEAPREAYSRWPVYAILLAAVIVLCSAPAGAGPGYISRERMERSANSSIERGTMPRTSTTAAEAHRARE